MFRKCHILLSEKTFFLDVHTRGGGIQTSDLHFIMCNSSRLKYFMKTIN